jgi:cell division protease FtsH
MGFALFGQEDRALYEEGHFHDAMVAALGGRAAEELVYGRISSGAKNDLEKVNAIARAAVTEYGMSSGFVSSRETSADSAIRRRRESTERSNVLSPPRTQAR